MWIRYDQNAALNMNHIERLYYLKKSSLSDTYTIIASMVIGTHYDLLTAESRHEADAVMNAIYSAVAVGETLCDIRRVVRDETDKAKAVEPQPDNRDEVIAAQSEVIHLLNEISKSSCEIILQLTDVIGSLQVKSEASDATA